MIILNIFNYSSFNKSIKMDNQPSFGRLLKKTTLNQLKSREEQTNSECVTTWDLNTKQLDLLMNKAKMNNFQIYYLLIWMKLQKKLNSQKVEYKSQQLNKRYNNKKMRLTLMLFYAQLINFNQSGMKRSKKIKPKLSNERIFSIKIDTILFLNNKLLFGIIKSQIININLK